MNMSGTRSKDMVRIIIEAAAEITSLAMFGSCRGDLGAGPFADALDPVVHRQTAASRTIILRPVW